MTAAKRRSAVAGEIVAIDDGMVTNIDHGKDSPPDGEPWRAWLFVVRLQGGAFISDVVEVEAEHRGEFVGKLMHLVSSVGGDTSQLARPE